MEKGAGFIFQPESFSLKPTSQLVVRENNPGAFCGAFFRS
jgi:hypothetical protein